MEQGYISQALRCAREPYAVPVPDAHGGIARHGIEAITAPAGVQAAPLQTGRADVDLHLPENRPVTFRLILGRRKPLDWVKQAAHA